MRDGEDGADGSEGEELLEEFVVGLLACECAEGRDDESIGVEAVSEDRFLGRRIRGGTQIIVRPVRVSGPCPRCRR